MMGTQLLWMSMPFVDNVVVGQLGQEPLAALGICSTYYIFFLVTAIGILSALNPLISHEFGAKQFEKIGPFVQSGIVLGLAYSVVLIIALVFAEPVLLMMGQNPSLVQLGLPYLRALTWGIPASMVFLAFRQLCDAIGFPTPVIIMTAIAAVGNTFLDIALVHGWGPFPRIGIAGAGYATSAMNWLIAIGLWLFTLLHPRFAQFRVWESFTARTSFVKETLIIGAPLAGGILMEVGYFSGSTWLAGLIGSLETAAHSIALNVASITFMVPLGLSFAVSVRLGHFAGAGDNSGIRTTGKLAIQNALTLAILNAGLLFVFAHSIAQLYTSDIPTVELSVLLLRVAGLFQIFDGLQCLGIHALRGLKDTKIPFLFSMVSYWLVGMGLSLLLGFQLKMGILGIWYGMIVALLVAAVLNISRFRKLAFS